jgi:hypothetical protein
LEVDSVDITFSHINSELTALLEKNILEAAKIVVKRIWLSEYYSQGFEHVLFKGHVTPSFDRATVTLNCVSLAYSLGIQIPRNLYQDPCNHALFDEGCGVNPLDFRVGPPIPYVGHELDARLLGFVDPFSKNIVVKYEF